jgi:hypothetical protein
LRRTLDIFIFFYKLLLKAELCVIGTLLLLFSITSIFNNSVVVKDASAQQVQQVTTQCLKCADLAIIQSGGQAQQTPASDALIGTPTNNIFTTCDSDTPQTGFNATIDATTGLNAGQKAIVKNAFAECLTNAPDSAAVAAQIELLQDTSITTTTRVEPEIPSLNTLLENPHLKALLENPELDVMIENNDVNALLEDPNVKALLEDPNVKVLLEDPAIKAQLENPSNSVPTGLFP